MVAVGNSILTIAWYLLSGSNARFTDLGPTWHGRLAPQRRKRQLIAELERLPGMKVTLEDEAAWHTRAPRPSPHPAEARSLALRRVLPPAH